MNPCEMNIAIASLSNYLYTELCEEDFECLALFLNELSKSMFTMSVHEKLCSSRNKNRGHHRGRSVGKAAAAAAARGSGDDAPEEATEALADRNMEESAMLKEAAETSANDENATEEPQ